MAKKQRLTQDEVVAHIKDGWEFGMSSSRYWLQKPALCCGGETKDVYAQTARALFRKKIIKVAPKKAGDAFWLTRLELTVRP